MPWRRITLPDQYALIVAGSPYGPPVELLRRLSEKATLIVAADSGADHLARAGIPFSHIAGDFDSISEEAREFARSCGAEWHTVPQDKDFTDLRFALFIARQSGASHIVLSACTAGRLDHVMGVMGTMIASSDLHPLLVDENEIVCILGAQGPRASVELAALGLSIGDTFSVLAPVGPATVTEKGVQWPLDYKEIAPLDGLGISNVMISDDATVIADAGVIVVVVSRGQRKLAQKQRELALLQHELDQKRSELESV
ncbi:MAG: thiamine diphosphokinase [Actinobacteria bacterium]|nr:thiamine diphosphokinase [Actinomycetota bacterium]